ncbi:class I SAM-dependent DNA methyltransferase [Succinimonas sp.]|uniref:HsdM family class I SAM-dependent methyltransferase n=1 Tax=Succinimonas sp. TaxID=1936151 RepID=UPI00386F1AEE
MSIEEYLDNIKGMIDDLKAMTSDLGLNNTGDEYKIISELFTYKFLNDKLVQEFENRENKDENYQEFIDFADADTARINEEYLLNNLFQRQNEPEFPALFDQAFTDISELNKEIYSIETTSGTRKPLLEPLSVFLRDEDKEAELAKRSINILNKYTFIGIYSKGWDYFSTIFEYLIKDYNKDSGSYAEYYTPAFAGAIMANILYNDTPVDRVSVYDPAAGSGTLLLSMANAIGVKNCTLYSQDRSQKSTQFLRINLILNNLAHSLANVIEGNTMTKPSHLNGDKLKQFDFIVSNPPFNVDFSADVATMQTDPYGRFFAGIPNIPRVDKTDMAIYLTFLQHIMASLSDKGKAAVVVPTGFLDKNKRASKIAYSIRERLIENNWLVGTISMPSNIFATTGTNVSILFIDKAKSDERVFLFDASRFGEKVSLSDGQRTLLSEEEISRIIEIFKTKKEIEDTSVYIDKAVMKDKSYSFSSGQYYQAKMEYVELSEDDFKNEISAHKTKLSEYFKEGSSLQEQILSGLGELIYDEV